MGRVIDELDHPIPFIFFTTLAVVGTASIVTWAAKRFNVPGLAALFQHP